MLGAYKSKAVLIGDSKYDAIGAMQSGIDFIAVTYGFGFENESDADEYENVCVCGSVEEIGLCLMND
ncbi:MAG: HAD hydrolase-like protein [Oscillospiraceae bacterium]